MHVSRLSRKEIEQQMRVVQDDVLGKGVGRVVFFFDLVKDF